MRRADFLSGTLLALLGLVMVVWVIPAETFSGDEGEIAPAFVPSVTMIVIGVLGALLVLARLPVLMRYLGGLAGTLDAQPFDRVSLKVIFITGAGLFAALAVFAGFGYIAMGIATVIAFSLYLGRTNWVALAVVAALVPVGTYFVVLHALRVAMP